MKTAPSMKRVYKPSSRYARNQRKTHFRYLCTVCRQLLERHPVAKHHVQALMHGCLPDKDSQAGTYIDGSFVLMSKSDFKSLLPSGPPLRAFLLAESELEFEK